MEDRVNQLLKVLPDKIFIECEAIAWDKRQKSFRIGEIANEIKDQLRRSNQLSEVPGEGKFCVMDVYKAVSRMLNHEWKPRTVREYARIEAMFSFEDREEYSELPFSHFRFAATTEKPFDVLKISAAEAVRRNGTAPSVEWLENWFFGDRRLPQAPPTFEDSPVSAGQRSPGSGGGSVAVAGRTSTRERLTFFSESFETVLEELELPDIVHGSVMSLWRQIVSILEAYKGKDRT